MLSESGAPGCAACLQLDDQLAQRRLVCLLHHRLILQNLIQQHLRSETISAVRARLRVRAEPGADAGAVREERQRLLLSALIAGLLCGSTCNYGHVARGPLRPQARASTSVSGVRSRRSTLFWSGTSACSYSRIMPAMQHIFRFDTQRDCSGVQPNVLNARLGMERRQLENTNLKFFVFMQPCTKACDMIQEHTRRVIPKQQLL